MNHPTISENNISSFWKNTTSWIRGCFSSNHIATETRQWRNEIDKELHALQLYWQDFIFSPFMLVTEFEDETKMKG